MRRMMVLLSFVGVATLGAQERGADELLREMERAIAPPEYHAVFSLETHYPDRRDPAPMVFEAWYKEGVGTLMEIMEPARSKGLRFLQKEGALWMFNPHAGSRRPVRLSAMASFQGSLFSNHDVSDPQYSDDYTAVLSGTERVEHPELGIVEAYVVDAKAAHRAAPYGSLRVWIVKDGSIPWKMEFYSKSGFLLKVLWFSGLKDVAGRVRPTRWRVESLEQEGAYSVVEVRTMEAVEGLPDERFSLAALTR